MLMNYIHITFGIFSMTNMSTLGTSSYCFIARVLPMHQKKIRIQWRSGGHEEKWSETIPWQRHMKHGASPRTVVPVLPPELCRELWLQHLACAVPGYRSLGKAAPRSPPWLLGLLDHGNTRLCWDPMYLSCGSYAVFSCCTKQSSLYLSVSMSISRDDCPSTGTPWPSQTSVWFIHGSSQAFDGQLLVAMFPPTSEAQQNPWLSCGILWHPVAARSQCPWREGPCGEPILGSLEAGLHCLLPALGTCLGLACAAAGAHVGAGCCRGSREAWEPQI